ENPAPDLEDSTPSPLFSSEQLDFSAAPKLEIAAQPSSLQDGIRRCFLGQGFDANITPDSQVAFASWLFDQYPQFLPSPNLPSEVQEQQKQEIIFQVIADHTSSLFSSPIEGRFATSLINEDRAISSSMINSSLAEFHQQEGQKALSEVNYDTKTGLRTLKTASEFLSSYMTKSFASDHESRLNFLNRLDVIATDLQNMKAANDNIAGQEKVDECLLRISKFHNHIAQLLNQDSPPLWQQAVLTPQEMQERSGADVSDDQEIIAQIQQDPELLGIISELKSLLEGYLPFRQYTSGDEFMYAFVTRRDSAEDKERSKALIDQLITKVLDHTPLEINPDIPHADSYHQLVRESFALFFNNICYKYPKADFDLINSFVDRDPTLEQTSIADLSKNPQLSPAINTVFQLYKNVVFAELFTKFLTMPNNHFFDPLQDGEPFLFGFVGSHINKNNQFFPHLTEEEKQACLARFSNQVISPELDETSRAATLAQPREAIFNFFSRALENGVNTNKAPKNCLGLISAYTGNPADIKRMAPQTIGSRKITENVNFSLVVRILGEVYGRMPESNSDPQLDSFLRSWHDITPANTTLEQLITTLNRRHLRRRQDDDEILTQSHFHNYATP
ncbi:hypothetical protein FWH30_03415, partial [Microgenomates group bacterium]|nr:hypothetical protein [Microgenomates group bacterium]